MPSGAERTLEASRDIAQSRQWFVGEHQSHEAGGILQPPVLHRGRRHASALRLSPGCVVRDFEAVALPGARKGILGLLALRSAAPFTVHLEPLHLELNCTTPVARSPVISAVDLAASH